MNHLEKTTKDIIISLLVISVVLLAFGYFFRDTSFLNSAFGEVSFAIYSSGVIFGIIFSIAKVFLIRFSLKSSLIKSKNKATMVSFGHYLTRYLLTGLVLFISIISDSFDFFGTILGVLALQPASYMAGYAIKKNGNKAQVEQIQRELDI